MTNHNKHNTNASPPAPQLRKLNLIHPLSLVQQNIRNVALTNFTSSRTNYIQSPIHHIVTHQSQSEDTYEQIIEQPHITNFRSQNNHFCVAHNEPTSWIPSPLNLPSSQSPKPNSHHLTFCFSAT